MKTMAPMKKPAAPMASPTRPTLGPKQKAPTPLRQSVRRQKIAKLRAGYQTEV